MARPLAGLLLVVAWVLTWRPALDPDLWWHLERGRLILTDGSVPTVERWSWWTAGEPILSHSWLWEVLVAVAAATGGLFAVSLLGALVSGAAVVLLWVLTGRAGPGIGPVARSVLVVLAVATAVVSWSPRAQSVDLVAVLAVALAWRTYLADGRPGWLVVLPLTALAWVNLHGSAAPLALTATLAACAVATTIGERSGAWRRRPRMPLVVATAAAVVALVGNPAGAALVAYPFDASTASAFSSAIQEWRSPDLAALGSLPFTAALVAAVGAGFLVLTRRAAAPDPLLALLALGWTVAALTSARFVLLAGPLLVLVAGSVWLDRAGRRRATPPAPTRISGAPRSLGVIAAVAALAVLAAGTTLIAPSTQDRLVAARFPVDAADRLLASGCTGRILNAYDWGGYLLHRGLTIGAYGDSPGHVVRMQADLEAGSVDIPATLEDLRVEVALVHPDGPLASALRSAPGWRVAFDDGRALLAVRRDRAVCQML